MAAAVRFHYGSADRQPHAAALQLRGKERVEYPIDLVQICPLTICSGVCFLTFAIFRSFLSLARITTATIIPMGGSKKAIK